MSTEILLSRMTWEEIKQRTIEGGIAILPVGATEEHGPHIAVNADSDGAYEMSVRAARLVAEEVRPVIAPTIPYGVGPKSVASDFPGTLFISIDALKKIVKEVCEGLVLSGFKKVVIVDGHGGNYPALYQVVREVTEETGAICFTVKWWDLIPPEISDKLLETESCHACEFETSVNLALGNRVLLEKVTDSPLTNSVRALESKYCRNSSSPVFQEIHGAVESGSLWAKGDLLKSTHGTGVMGHPKKASLEKGKILVDSAVARLAEFLRDLNQLKE